MGVMPDASVNPFSMRACEQDGAREMETLQVGTAWKAAGAAAAGAATVAGAAAGTAAACSKDLRIFHVPAEVRKAARQRAEVLTEFHSVGEACVISYLTPRLKWLAKPA